MQIESPLQKPIQTKQHIVQMILSVATFILFFYLWRETSRISLKGLFHLGVNIGLCLEDIKTQVHHRENCDSAEIHRNTCQTNVHIVALHFFSEKLTFLKQLWPCTILHHPYTAITICSRSIGPTSMKFGM